MTFEKQTEMILVASMVCDTVVTETLDLYECRNQLIYIRLLEDDVSTWWDARNLRA